jgi:hypothetical protein
MVLIILQALINTVEQVGIGAGEGRESVSISAIAKLRGSVSVLVFMLHAIICRFAGWRTASAISWPGSFLRRRMPGEDPQIFGGSVF